MHVPLESSSWSRGPRARGFAPPGGPRGTHRRGARSRGASRRAAPSPLAPRAPSPARRRRGRRRSRPAPSVPRPRGLTAVRPSVRASAARTASRPTRKSSSFVTTRSRYTLQRRQCVLRGEQGSDVRATTSDRRTHPRRRRRPALEAARKASEGAKLAPGVTTIFVGNLPFKCVSRRASAAASVARLSRALRGLLLLLLHLLRSRMGRRASSRVGTSGGTSEQPTTTTNKTGTATRSSATSSRRAAS